MISSMYTAVSGLNSEDTQLSVIGNNIANQNTVGFKNSDTAFGDVLSSEMAGMQVGSGVRVDNVSQQFTQGALETTSNALDMAIEGNGFFVVNGSSGERYTRAGQFSMDKSGNIVDSQGDVLQGYQADANGNITGTIGNLTLTVSQIPPQETTSVGMKLNLQSTAPVTGAFSLTGGTGGTPTNFDYSTAVTAYDVQGVAHQVTAYFTNTGASGGNNNWTVNYVYNDTSGNPTVAGTQNLSFNSSGALVSDSNDAPITFNFATSQNIAFDYGTAISAPESGTGLDGTTQFASDFSVENITQDGSPAGTLENYSIDKNGVITGTFTNGQQKTLGQVVLANFDSPTSLQQLDGNLYSQTVDSGQALIGKPQTAGLGSVNSGSLEESNVDLSDQFVKMIAAQSGYEANSKMITTMDQLMQTLVNMKQ